MLKKTVYPLILGPLNKIAGFLDKRGFTPNQLTLAGMALNFFAGYIYATGQLQLGAIMLIVAGLGDLLDGALARSTGKTSSFGALLDSFCDRYSDFFLFGGLALFFARHDDPVNAILCLFALAGAYNVSYTKARAENFIKNCGIGIFDRPVRLIILCLGTLITPLLTLSLWVLAIGANVTAIQRLLHARAVLNKTKEDA